MKILVCISHVPDTTTKIKFIDGKSLDTAGVQWIINPWDELALTRALELKESSNGLIDHVSVITVGGPDTEPTIRKALAIGADSAIRVNAAAGDTFFVAYQVAEAIKNSGFDIILAGIDSCDFNGSSFGSMLGEFLSITSVSSVSGVNFNGNDISVDREIDGGKEILSCPVPFVAIVQKGITKEPRIPSMRGIMTARTKPLAVVEPVACEALTEFLSFELPKHKASCRMVDPENVKELVELLRNEAKVI
ncbi:MAG: electron transfer flavoprotein subunit beta/FixA family protein [Bacteroidia bacterium]|nr:electron transfer flavoprotein subunit beta/FixA family protein [Bacteroidia bacterium]